MIQQLCAKEVLLESAKEVFETMVFMDINENHEPVRKTESWALLSSITFKGAFQGCLTVGCDVSCAQAITKNMLGIDTAEELNEEDVCDAIGEIANMVMGGVKERLRGHFGDVAISVPSVVTGAQLQSNIGLGVTKTSIKVALDDEHSAVFSLLYRESITE